MEMHLEETNKNLDEEEEEEMKMKVTSKTSVSFFEREITSVPHARHGAKQTFSC